MGTLTIPANLDELIGHLTGSAFIEDEGQRNVRIAGADWPLENGVTMIGHVRLKNMRDLIERVVAAEVPGDVMECGVWRGGACIFMRAVLKALGDEDRTVWVADSFEGCPPGDHAFKELAVPLSEVVGHFERFGLLDDKVHFIPGWFNDSLPGPVEQLALLRIDCDLYESYRVVMERMYPLVSSGGYVILDDYLLLPEAARAVDEYRAAHGITAKLEKVDGYAVFWQKP